MLPHLMIRQGKDRLLNEPPMMEGLVLPSPPPKIFRGALDAARNLKAYLRPSKFFAQNSVAKI